MNDHPRYVPDVRAVYPERPGRIGMGRKLVVEGMLTVDPNDNNRPVWVGIGGGERFLIVDLLAAMLDQPNPSIWFNEPLRVTVERRDWND